MLIQPGQRCRYEVIAMAVGGYPTLIGPSAWLVAVRIGVTLFPPPDAEPKSAT